MTNHDQTVDHEQPIGYRAKWIFPAAAAPIENGIVVCRRGEIIEVGNAKKVDCAEIRDLGEVAIIPGLINAYTRLQFSDLDAPPTDPADGFIPWFESLARLQQDTAEVKETISKGCLLYTSPSPRDS